MQSSGGRAPIKMGNAGRQAGVRGHGTMMMRSRSRPWGNEGDLKRKRAYKQTHTHMPSEISASLLFGVPS